MCQFVIKMTCVDIDIDKRGLFIGQFHVRDNAEREDMVPLDVTVVTLRRRMVSLSAQ